MLTVDVSVLGDVDDDSDVDADDFLLFADSMAGPEVTDVPPGVDPAHFENADLDFDEDVDLADFSVFQREFGPSRR